MGIKLLIFAIVIIGVINVAVSNIVARQLDPIAIKANNTEASDFIHPNKNAFLDWIAGLTGFTSTEKPTPLPPPKDCSSCTCGLINKKKRIVGGEVTEVNQYPWMSMLLYSGRFYCGSTLINDRYVITAAHCIHGFNKDKVTVRFMEHDTLISSETQTIDRKVLRVVRHNNYNPSNYNSDIALLKLDSPVEFVNSFCPVCIAIPGKSYTGDTGIVTGWGATKESGPISTKLQEVEVPIISNEKCRYTGYAPHKITDNMMCAGHTNGGKDSCQGDSGGPLHVLNQTTSTYEIVGIVSWGEGCAQPNYPGVYTRVNRYGTWIRKNTEDACYCD